MPDKLEALKEHEQKLHNAGTEIAKLLNLRKIGSFKQKGRYATAFGTKSEVGIARSVLRVLSENNLCI